MMVSAALVAALVLGPAGEAEGGWCTCWCECERAFTPQGTPYCDGWGSCCSGMRAGSGGREG